MKPSMGDGKEKWGRGQEKGLVGEKEGRSEIAKDWNNCGVFINTYSVNKQLKVH